MRKILAILFILLLGLTALETYMLYKSDLSLQPIAEYRKQDKTPRLPVYLVSYADGNEVFYRNQNALAYSAINKGFDVIVNYRRELLDAAFLKKYQDILAIKTGAGLWLWKPQIMLQALAQAPENAIIVYTDVGFIYVYPIDDLIPMTKDHDILLMNIDDYHSKEKLTKWLPKKIADEWHLDSMLEKQRPKFIESGLMVVKNTPRTRKFMQAWLEICARRDYAFLKYDAKADGIKGFTYDQSLLSLIAHKYPDGVKIIPKQDFKRYTVFHHRHPGNNKPVLPLQVLPAKQLREWLGEKFPSLFLIIGF